jgi:hypothetical protein
MKKISFMLILVFAAALLMAVSGTIKVNDNPAKVQLLENNKNGLSVHYALDEIQFRDINTKEGIFTELISTNYTSTNTKVYFLPLMRQLISVPLGDEVSAYFTTLTQRP